MFRALALWEEARGTGVKVSCLCPGPTATKFRARAATSSTRMARSGSSMASAPVARVGYRGFQRNRRVVVAGTRNAIMAWLGVPSRTLLCGVNLVKIESTSTRRVAFQKKGVI